MNLGIATTRKTTTAIHQKTRVLSISRIQNMVSFHFHQLMPQYCSGVTHAPVSRCRRLKRAEYSRSGVVTMSTA